jgi:NAD+ synthase (glutamine-hydrolysing)
VTVLRIALAQLNPTVGDLEGNLAKLIDAYDRAEAAGCDVIAYPELSITGYPPEDLVLKPRFVADNRAALDRFAAHTGSCAAVVGFVDADRDIYNAAAVCVGGEVVGTYRKRLLPNYAVFDEARTFTPGTDNDPLELYEIAGVKVGVSICEDIWSPFGPLAIQAAGGAELSVNINGSPYHWDKDAGRERMVATRAQDAHTPIVYVNQVGGQD